MTDQYAYFVKVSPEYTADRPESLWRRSASGWEYLSLIDWSWRATGSTRPVVAAPPEDALVPVDEARAGQLASDRQIWVRYWAIYRGTDLGSSDQPINVLRRRSSPEDLCEEVFADNQWVRTSVLTMSESGMSSVDIPLRLIDVDEAEEILSRAHGVAGKTAL